MTVLLKTIEIDNVDVSSSLINFEIERNFGDAITQIELEVISLINDSVTLAVGQSIEIWSGYTTATDTKIFDGRIEKYTPEGGKIKIIGKDKIWDLVKKEVNKSYDYNIDASAGKISEIFKDLATTHGGLSADATSVQDSGTVNIIKKFKCKHASIFERCRALAEALDWQFYYRPDTDLVYFEPKGFTTNTTPLTVGDNVISVPTWKYDSTEMVNVLTVKGVYVEVETTETGQIGVTAGYTTTGIWLTYTPASVKIYADAVNPPTTLREGGVTDAPGTYYYNIDSDNKKIVPRDGTTFTNNFFFEIRYSRKKQSEIKIKNQESIDSYTEFNKTINLIDLEGTDDAEIRAQKYITKYSTPFVSTTLKVECTEANNYIVGDCVQVIDNVSNPIVDQSFVINKQVIRYPGDYMELYVGDKEWRLAEWQGKIEERLKHLEESGEGEEILIQLFNLGRNISYKRRDFKLNKYSSFYLTDSFILGHAVNGLLGVGAILDDMNSSSASWTGSNIMIADESAIKIVGAGSLRCIFTIAGTCSITTSQSFGDISAYTGVANGVPSQGTIGLWMYSPNTTCFTALNLKIGSGASDYLSINATEYTSVDSYAEWGSLAFGLHQGWNYYMFDLDAGAATGTPDWTACDYAVLTFTTTEIVAVYADYFTISKSNYIGLNGLGRRLVDYGVTRIVPGSMIFKEYLYDEDYKDIANTTATVDTTNHEVNFD